MNTVPPPVLGIGATTGNTPLVRLSRLGTRTDIQAWAKLEGFNPGGSAKDRTAAALLRQALSSGQIAPGGTVVESSSGNLGMALARECSLQEISFHCVIDPRTNRHALAVMQALGATVHEVSAPDPATGDWLAARRQRVTELVSEIPGAITLDQYSNRAAFQAHAEGTMREIVDQLGHPPAHLFVAVSTTGTLGGCLRYLRQAEAATQVTAVDAAGSVLFGGRRGQRLLPGYGAGMVPALSREAQPDKVARMSAAQAVTGARLVARREGFLPGASGGAVTAAFLAQEPELIAGEDAVLIFHDHGHAYLDTIYNDAWVNEHIGAPADAEQKL